MRTNRHHKYIAKVPAGSGRYRYFYSRDEYDAFRNVLKAVRNYQVGKEKAARRTEIQRRAADNQVRVAASQPPLRREASVWERLWHRTSQAPKQASKMERKAIKAVKEGSKEFDATDFVSTVHGDPTPILRRLFGKKKKKR